MKAFFKKNENLLIDLEFIENPIIKEKEEEDEPKKFFEILIAFIMKIFSWLFEWLNKSKKKKNKIKLLEKKSIFFYSNL